MIQAGFITVELVDHNGKQVPNLEDLEDLNRFVVSSEDNRWTLEEGKHTLNLFKLGRYNGNLIFFASTNSEVVITKFKTRLGDNRVVSVKEALRNAAFSNWVLNTIGLRPIRRSSDNAVVGIVPKDILHGQNELVVGLDGDLEEGETYTF